MADWQPVDETEVMKLGYRPGLDGLRGVAVLLVVACHIYALTGGWRIEGGFVGVDVFFVLSGFLITTLLLEGDRLRCFYMRRARRLLPAVGVLLAVAAVVGAGWFAVASTGLYMANWAHLHDAWSSGPMGMTHLWSLAIEEQFYLAWPAVLLLGRFDRKRLGVAVLAVAAGVVAWRAVLHGAGVDPVRLYKGTDTHADGLMMGAGVALLWPWAGEFRRACVRWAPVACVTLALFVLTLDLESAPVGLPAVNVCALVLVVAAVEGWGRWPRSLVQVGRWSYSLYLWHYPIFMAVTDLPATWRWVVGVGGTVAATLMSYYLIERRFRTGSHLARDVLDVHDERVPGRRRRPLKHLVGGGVGAKPETERHTAA